MTKITRQEVLIQAVTDKGLAAGLDAAAGRLTKIADELREEASLMRRNADRELDAVGKDVTP